MLKGVLITLKLRVEKVRESENNMEVLSQRGARGKEIQNCALLKLLCCTAIVPQTISNKQKPPQDSLADYWCVLLGTKNWILRRLECQEVLYCLPSVLACLLWLSGLAIPAHSGEHKAWGQRSWIVLEEWVRCSVKSNKLKQISEKLG